MYIKGNSEKIHMKMKDPKAKHLRRQRETPLLSFQRGHESSKIINKCNEMNKCSLPTEGKLVLKIKIQHAWNKVKMKNIKFRIEF